MAEYVQNCTEKPVKLQSLLMKVKELKEANEDKGPKKRGKRKSLALNSTSQNQKERSSDDEGGYRGLLKENSSQTLTDVWEQINSSLRVIDGDESCDDKLKSSYAIDLLKKLKADTLKMHDNVEKLLEYIQSKNDQSSVDMTESVNSVNSECDVDSHHLTDLNNQESGAYHGSAPLQGPSTSVQQDRQQIIADNQSNFQHPSYQITPDFQQNMSFSPFYYSQNMQQSMYSAAHSMQTMPPVTQHIQTFQTPTSSLSNQQGSMQHYTSTSGSNTVSQPDGPHQMQHKTAQGQDSSDSEDELMVATPLRRSPRKKLFAPQTTPASSKMVKLMSNSDVMVEASKLKRARQSAFKHPKPAYTLMGKLMPCVFSKEEMANSRGQGLGPAKKGDLRPVLDPAKIQLCKDYVAAWLKETNLVGHGDSELNHAVTQQIDAARKHLRQINSPHNK